ncbi:FAD-dependent oxidoreductase [Kribbella sandramycini]|uniref:ferredoxin--NADP(+) reductase n=1 Tax=Kribbella sandramycini TaxID=60450 RepID=A0A7Y4P043_9ACTN|nr:FAD-dependent oxidoreductase [Kribbella sandramycini]MBB6569419.1 ferredoxin--NADP+ reductase [Kribbella sandramycini]NOL40745.1 FAD-dependent oxidoreductase [Kribbella sandramycini]
MPYAITQSCCSDASCVAVCPVNCIHPTPEERAFGNTDMLYVDPDTCISCGACSDACPADAIHPIESLTGALQDYAAINAAYFEDIPTAAAAGPLFHNWEPPEPTRTLPSAAKPLRVAIVGTGPAGMYAAEDLLLHTNAEVTLIDRLAQPGGLLRYGVAPDHLATRRITNRFTRFHNHPRARSLLGVDVGATLTNDDVLAHHDAVIYAVGSTADRRLGIPGEDLPGSLAARDIVSWYNAHPDAAPVDLPDGRVVIAGSGNVALDVARILAADPATLTDTEIAEGALSALFSHTDREIVVLTRRGPADAAYTLPELHELKNLPGVQLVVDPRGAEEIATSTHPKAVALRDVRQEAINWQADPTSGRRIVLRFHSTPTDLVPDGPRLGSVRLADGELVKASLFIRSIGYRGTPIPGLPFDDATAVVPNTAGRVTDRPGTYVVGWIKRGPTGGIGTNRTCAAETVTALLEDAAAGRLTTPRRSTRRFHRLAKRARRT